jgi:serine/threonine protein kinase
VQRFEGTATTGAVGTIGRYALHDRIASGGMASVHLGRLRGEGGFARIVAIKRLHPHLGQDPTFVSMFLDEARLVARIRHPNVVPTLDVIAADGEMLLVMEYVSGESLSRLAGTMSARGERMPVRIAAAILCGALHGLHAAHEARDERGEPLYIVHRDVSPQNILVGVDGATRLLDFGVAKARSRLAETRDGELKGKLAYMAPEQLREREADRTTDVYASGVVLWEALTGQRLYGEAMEAALVERILYGEVQPPSSVVPALPAAIDAVVLRALSRERGDRYPTAREMAEAVEAALGSASMNEVSAWVTEVAGTELARRASLVAQVESSREPVSGRRPSQVAPMVSGVEEGPTERTFPRGARIGVGVAAAVMVAAGFLVARSFAPSAAETAPAVPSASAVASSARRAVASAAPTGETASVTSPQPPVEDSGVVLAPAAPRAPATVRVRGHGGKTRNASSLPDGLPSDRE